MIMLKFTEKQGFTLSLVDTFSEKSSRGGTILTPLSLFRVKFIQTLPRRNRT